MDLRRGGYRATAFPFIQTSALIPSLPTYVPLPSAPARGIMPRDNAPRKSIPANLAIPRASERSYYIFHSRLSLSLSLSLSLTFPTPN